MYVPALDSAKLLSLKLSIYMQFNNNKTLGKHSTLMVIFRKKNIRIKIK